MTLMLTFCHQYYVYLLAAANYWFLFVRGQSATSMFRGSHRSKQSEDCQSLASSHDNIILNYEKKLRDQVSVIVRIYRS